MKRVNITEVQFINLNQANKVPSRSSGVAKTVDINYDKAKAVNIADGDSDFYVDGDFRISKNRMDKARKIFYPYYKDVYGEDIGKMIRQFAFSTTIDMLDNGENIPEFGDYKKYHSLYRNIPFSPMQVKWVENKIKNKYAGMSAEELYDQMLIGMERNGYNLEKKSTDAISELYSSGFFRRYRNGILNNVAKWYLGKLKDDEPLLNWLGEINPFTGNSNAKTCVDFMSEDSNKIADSEETFNSNPKFLAFNQLSTKIRSYATSKKQ